MISKASSQRYISISGEVSVIVVTSYNGPSANNVIATNTNLMYD